ncbi:MAG: helix-turn-helix domain-containing protein [Candidatus Buchananbacteria bacterium]|nr:helix-turn-helix domain-containing protein [Candidatus Buchananbacteria bacterium]
MVRKITPRTLGEILAEARNKRYINLDEAAKDLNIPFRYLEALEHNNFKDLPDKKNLKAILKKYGLYLKLDFSNLWQLLKNDKNFYSLNKYKKVENKYFTSWPKLIRKLSIIVVIGAVLFFLGLKVEQIFSPPILEINYPYDGLIVNTRQIELSGRSEKEVELIINNKEIFVDDGGNFETIIDLQKGLNLIKISAKKRYSRTIEQEIRLLFKD